MNKKLRLSIFLMLGVLIFVFVLAGCEKIPAKTPGENPSEKVGKLYTLQEALDRSLLTMDDVREIANLYNNKLEPEKPLDEMVAQKIRETELADLKSKVGLNGELLYPNKSIDDIILEYYGEYNGCYAVLITIKGFAYMDVVSPQSFGNEITINYTAYNFIMVWTEKTVKSYGKLYTLQEALEFSLLTLDDIREIANYHNNNWAPENPLDDEIALKIREARLAEVRAMTHSNGTPQFPNANIDDISIFEYCGEYNGSYAVLISTGLYAVADVSSTHIFGDGIRIHYGSPNYIRVWTEKVF